MAPLEGRSFVPLLKNKSMSPRQQPLFWEWYKGRAVQHRGWKAISWDEEPWELYHLAEDGIEANNLAEEYPEKRDSLVQAFMAWQKRVNQLSPIAKGAADRPPWPPGTA